MEKREERKRENDVENRKKNKSLCKWHQETVNAGNSKHGFLGK